MHHVYEKLFDPLQYSRHSTINEQRIALLQIEKFDTILWDPTVPKSATFDQRFVEATVPMVAISGNARALEVEAFVKTTEWATAITFGRRSLIRNTKNV